MANHYKFRRPRDTQDAVFSKAKRHENKLHRPLNQQERIANHYAATVANTRKRVIGIRGAWGRRILWERTVDGRVYSMHATKGLRVSRAVN